MPDDIEFLDDDEFYDDDEVYDNGLNLPHLPTGTGGRKSSGNHSKHDDSSDEDGKSVNSPDGDESKKGNNQQQNDDDKDKGKHNTVDNKKKSDANNSDKKENNISNYPNPINPNLPNTNNHPQNMVGQNLRNNQSPIPSALNNINSKPNKNLENSDGLKKGVEAQKNSDKNDVNTKNNNDKEDSNDNNLLSKLGSKSNRLNNINNDEGDQLEENNSAVSVTFKLVGSIAKKIIFSISPFVLLIAAIIVIIVVLLSTVSGVENEVNNIYEQINGSKEIDENDENYEFINRLRTVNNNYISQNKMPNIPMVISTFVVISLEDDGIKLNDITESQIESVINAMLNGNSYSEDIYKQNLPNVLYGYFPSYSTEKINSVIDDVFSHYENYVSIYGEPSLAIRNVAVFDAYWWPIGSSNTTNENGRIFASDTPATVNITSPFGDRVMNGETVFHSGIDIANGSAAGEVNIIASKAGEVIYPTDTSNISYGTGSYGNTDGGGLGNYVKIRHSDGTITVYGHMYADSITVRAGETVEQGQVIGKMGTSGSSTGVHLHFSVYVGGDSSTNAVDPLAYVDPNNPRQVSSGADFSLTNTVFSEEEFVAKMQDYYNRTGNANFLNNFLNNAREIYQASVDYGVNPELVVVTAATESGFRGCGTTGNYWGIGIPNGQGCSAGPTYATMRDGVKGYAETLASYNPGGSYASSITARYNERSAAGCRAGGYGLPGTLAGMQSIYSWLGDYRYNPGSSGKGGCYYLENELMYGAGYCSTVPTCSNYSSCPSNSKTTVCEQSDYTLLQITQKLKVRQDIFGL